MAPALAAQRATEVLRHVARHHDEGLTLTKLADRLSVSPAAMHAVLTALLDAGLLERLEPDKTFRLGPEAVVLGSAARSQHDDVAAASAAARRVAETHGLPTTVLALRDHEIVAIDGDGDHPAPINLGVPGHRVPFSPPFGTVFLATSPPQEVVAWFERARIDPASELAERYRAELAAVTVRGWSVGTLGTGLRQDLEWDQLVEDAASPDRVADWRYLVDDLLTEALTLPAVLTVALPPANGRQPHLALAVTGFEAPMTGAEIERFATAIAATARDAPGE